MNTVHVCTLITAHPSKAVVPDESRRLNYVDTGRWSDRLGGDEGKMPTKRKGSYLTNTTRDYPLMMRKKKVTNKFLFNRSVSFINRGGLCNNLDKSIIEIISSLS